MKRTAYSACALALSLTGSLALAQGNSGAGGGQSPPTPQNPPTNTTGQTQQRPTGFEAPTHWQRGSEILNGPVTGTGSASLGNMQDLVYDPSTGRVVYGIIGGAGQNASQMYAVPWSSLEAGSGSQNGYSMSMNSDRFGKAPHFTSSQWPEFNNRAWDESVYSYYGEKPYWGNPSNLPAGDPHRSWNEYPSSWGRLSELRNAQLRSAQGQDLGRLSDVSIDPTTGRIIYGIVNYNNKMYAVPWSAFKQEKDVRSGLTLNATADQLNGADSFTPDKWPNMSDPTWANRTYQHYNQKPYWNNQANGQVQPNTHQNQQANQPNQPNQPNQQPNQQPNPRTP